jgi:hypothetical protein
MVVGVIWHGNFNSWSKKSLHIVECLLNSLPPCGIIRTTAD